MANSKYTPMTEAEYINSLEGEEGPPYYEYLESFDQMVDSIAEAS